MNLLSFFAAYRDDIGPLVAQHLVIVAWALPIATLLGVAGGIALAGCPRLAAFAIGAAGVATTVPSVALFGLLIPLLAPLGMGVGRPPAIVAVALYSVLPILQDTIAGLEGVPRSVLESASAMGMTRRAVLWRVQLPLASPTLLTGIRTSAVMGIGITAIAAYVGAGGLG
ncbi:MAG: ABC transporter permease, partial [Cyanobacteria bacterium REEB65]|nr:ABC transporter permease [Cyanobacteria bacterium REEB65]